MPAVSLDTGIDTGHAGPVESGASLISTPASCPSLSHCQRHCFLPRVPVVLLPLLLLIAAGGGVGVGGGGVVVSARGKWRRGWGLVA